MWYQSKVHAKWKTTLRVICKDVIDIVHKCTMWLCITESRGMLEFNMENAAECSQLELHCNIQAVLEGMLDIHGKIWKYASSQITTPCSSVAICYQFYAPLTHLAPYSIDCSCHSDHLREHSEPQYITWASADIWLSWANCFYYLSEEMQIKLELRAEPSHSDTVEWLVDRGCSGQYRCALARSPNVFSILQSRSNTVHYMSSETVSEV